MVRNGAMFQEIEIVEVAPTFLAAVRQRAAWSDLSRVVPKLLGDVWDFLKTTPVVRAGHNVAIYRDARPQDVEVECGVQVAGPFAETARVRRAQTPTGSAAHAVHFGAYAELRKAHEAIAAFRKAHGYAEDVHWEIYGEWNDDPSKLRTDVYGLLSRRF